MDNTPMEFENRYGASIGSTITGLGAITGAGVGAGTDTGTGASAKPCIMISPDQYDSVVYSVIQQFTQRAQIGKAKYGTDLDRTDLSVLEWIQHAQEEHCDAILYLEKLKQLHTSK